LNVVPNIDLFKPDFVIDCSTLENAYEVYNIMRSNGITKMYCYTFSFKEDNGNIITMKIGESCPEPSNTTHGYVAERVGRQLAWLEGWGDQPKSDNGIDLSLNIKREIDNGTLPKYAIDKNRIVISVWNLDSRPVQAVVKCDRNVTKWTEGKLARDYKNSFKGTLPILNYKDPTKNSEYIRKYIALSHFNNLFKW